MPAGLWGLRVRGARVADEPIASVLVVDDDPAKRLALRAVLKPLNVHVVEAESGESALRRVIEQTFAVILLDVRMPGMDGFETAAMIRKRRESEMTPIIFITAFASDEIGPASRYVEGAVDFMFAPVAPDELRAKISVFVGLYLQAETFASQARSVQASADHLKLLTDSAPIGIFRTDADNKYLYTNPRWTEISGIASEDAFGRDWDTIIASLEPRGKPLDVADDSADLKGVGRRFELWLPDSTSRIVLVTSEAIRDDGEIVGWVGTLGDVTAETRAEEERSRFRSLVQNSRDVIAVIDASGRCTYVSPGIMEVSGYSPEEVIGAMGFDFIHPDDAGIVASHLQEIGGVPDATKTVEVRTRTKSGEWIWIEIRAANRLDDPSIQGIILNYHDITHRREAEEERLLLLSQQEELATQLRMLLDSTGEGIYGLDGTGACTFMNKAGAAFLGGEPEDFIGQNMHELTHHSHADGSAYPVVDSPITQMLSTGLPVDVPGDLLFRADGTSFPVDLSAHPIGGDGADQGGVVAFQDVTLRRKMEEELRQSEQLFRGAFDAAQTGIALTAVDGLTFVDVNRALCEMLGYSKDELLELDWRQIAHPEDLELDHTELSESSEARGVAEHRSKRYVRKDGESITVEMSESLVRGPEGLPMYFVTHANDVSQRDRAASETETLEAALVQAQKMEAVGQLAGGVAHDFNNILSVILNYARFAGEGLKPDDERLADIQEISKAGEKAASLVHQLLAFSRKEIVEERVIDLNAVVTDVYQILSRSLGEDIDLVFKAFEGLPPVNADPGRIEQVLLNLAVNARDAMPNGGVLNIATGTESIGTDSLSSLTRGDYVWITVSDSGMGMDEATVERIFDPFFTTKGPGEGSGMGLASAYGIIEQAGGGLFVESKRGVGTTFSIYLPESDDLVDSKVDEESVDAIRGSETILLVEDEDAVRELVARILRKQGYRVLPYSNGSEALEYCRTNAATIDLLLTDVVMPKMSGKELAEEATSVRGDLTTLFMSGYTDELIAQRGVASSGENLITKPFNPEKLLLTVRSLLDSKVAS